MLRAVIYLLLAHGFSSVISVSCAFFSVVCPQGATGLFGLMLKSDSSHCTLNPQEASGSAIHRQMEACSISGFCSSSLLAKSSHNHLTNLFIITPLLRAPLPKGRCFSSLESAVFLFHQCFPVCSLRTSKAEGYGKPPGRGSKPTQGTYFMESVEGSGPKQMTMNIWASVWEHGNWKLTMLGSCSEAQAPATRSHDSEHERPRIFLHSARPFSGSRALRLFFRSLQWMNEWMNE